jgi:Polyketide cyclase / dehydrase and lipid transport
MTGYRVEASRLVAVDPTQAFDRLISAPLPAIFSRRYAAFPPIKEVTDEPDGWGTVGQTRTILLADGGRLRQTLTSVDRPHGYSYVLDEIHGPLRPFVRTIDGAWSVTPEGAGARIGWSWNMHPKTSPARLTMNVIGRMWKGYADRALAELETVISDPAADR